MIRKKSKKRALTDSDFWGPDKPSDGDEPARVQTEWARGLVPGKVLTPPKRLATDDLASVALNLAAANRSEWPQGPTRPRDPATAGQAVPEEPEEPLLVSETLGGRYRLERVLGSGGMGVVYLAHDEQVQGETFAIKVLKLGLRGDALTLLRAEVHKTRKLSHPNIVDVHSLNSDSGRLYVLMEYLEGKPLNVLLDEDFGRGMPLSRALPVIEDVGAALACAHDHSVIHSDLKPANIFITTSGRTKLLDFGIARASRGQAANSGMFALTPAYASCEMLEGREPDARDDIYSFACVVYEMLSGKRPFGNADALAARVVQAQAAPLPALSKGQNAALAKALAFEREARTGSVEELLAGLSTGKTRRPLKFAAGALAGLFVLAAGTYVAMQKPWALKPAAPLPVATPAAPAAVFNPPPHSIAVLPFVNLSGDKEDDTFSDGLTEEVLNSLARINELQVAARTSSFSFKGSSDVPSIARKLNVSSVLAGSVRRSAHTLRVTVQLINAVTGYQMWSETYDKSLGDVLSLESDIATAVANAMKVTLLGQAVTKKIELGGTQNQAALDDYLRASRVLNTFHDGGDLLTAIGGFNEALAADPNYARALAGRARAENVYAMAAATGAAVRQNFDKARTDAQQALALAPDLPEGHLALAQYYGNGSLEFARANTEFERAAKFAPGDAKVLLLYGQFASYMGRADSAIATLQRAAALDPLDRGAHFALGKALYVARRYKEALAAFQDGLALDADDPQTKAQRGLTYYALGDLQNARTSCASNPDYWNSRVCLAITYDKLGKHEEAEAILKKFLAAEGDASAYQYAQIYAQWGDTLNALKWLDSARRVRDPGIINVKTDPLLDPLRSDPDFQALQSSLKFPG